ncbi:hypothetical protein Nmel_005329 [Mimus melanotis]
MFLLKDFGKAPLQKVLQNKEESKGRDVTLDLQLSCRICGKAAT